MAGPDQETSHAAAHAEPDPLWREAIAPYAKPVPWRTALDIVTGPVVYLALWPPMVYLLKEVSFWAMLPVAILASGFLLRTFILFHDCTHGSLFERREANLWAGRFFGLLVFHPFQNWRHSHAVHHGSAGDLDRRGTGDVHTLTLSEYRALDGKGRLIYRLFRNPVVMFTIGPIYSLMIMPRIVPKGVRPRIRNSVILTNIALVAVITAMCFLVGPWAFFIIEGPLVLLAGMAGVWLFYVQHQFEDVYWESSDQWSYADAALRGSSYLKLPKVLLWFSGNIGLHHVHHVSAKVPNYRLQAAHDNNEIFHDVPVLTFWTSWGCTRYKVIDDDTGRLLTWREVRQMDAAQPAPVSG